MTRAEYLDFKTKLFKVYAEFGFENIRGLRVRGQKDVEERILNRKLYNLYDEATYGSKDAYQEFLNTGNLKLVWARMSNSVREYKLDPYEVAHIARDRCPVTGALFDYGYGHNRITDNPYFRPGIDHIIARNNGGAPHGDINNIQIVSQQFNTVKSFGTEIEALKWVGFELKKHRSMLDLI